ncbi:MAG: cytochrome d ubiquinol oxidase subunit II [Alphaproteobacteria bacterium]|jgi:cytochrome d ubiquinol oxidase subunit II|nr:cytochrome d ubiquinol oxidase subunit II [Alphaproteobacteria bacterium]
MVEMAAGYEGLTFWLPLIWSALIAFAVAMYVIMDGFDLGVGILFDAPQEEAWRDKMMLSVAPIWDGNETWLVLGGGGLLAVFPLAYALLLPALYLPLIVMLIALVFRGVAFEFRFKAVKHKGVWNRSFHYGSLVATFAQGMVLGAFVQGFAVEGRSFAGGMFDWLTPFSILTGACLVAGYGLLGACWLVMKTEGALEAWARHWAQRFLVAVIVGMAAVSLWVPFLSPEIADRWFSFPNIVMLLPVPALTAVVALALFRTLRTGRTGTPFALTIVLFLLGYLGLAISLFPYLVPPDVTIWEAAAHSSSQMFALVGFIVVIPIILGYTAYTYWVFRGKVAEDLAEEGYH